jgi:hypothetical protein
MWRSLCVLVYVLLHNRLIDAIFTISTRETDMQRYRADKSEIQQDGARVWRAEWMGGPTLAKIENCRLNLAGEPRRTVYITGEPDTWFSIPAATRYLGKYVKGYVTGDDEGNLVFRHVYY